jgi:hypothetical protein
VLTVSQLDQVLTYAPPDWGNVDATFARRLVFVIPPVTARQVLGMWDLLVASGGLDPKPTPAGAEALAVSLMPGATRGMLVERAYSRAPATQPSLVSTTQSRRML